MPLLPYPTPIRAKITCDLTQVNLPRLNTCKITKVQHIKVWTVEHYRLQMLLLLHHMRQVQLHLPEHRGVSNKQ